MVAIAAETALVVAEIVAARDGGSRGSGSGHGGDNTAAMAAVTSAPNWHQQWQRGRQMWTEVIFCTNYYLHNCRVRMVQM